MSLNFQHIQGDTFKEVPFEILINSVALDLTDAVIKMQLRKECGGVPALTLTSVLSDGITITDAVNGLFKINERIINISEYDYLYDIQITLADGTVNTWVSGNFLIKCDITR